MKYLRKYEDVNVFALNGKRFILGAAFTIPGIGIFIGENQRNNKGLLRHEFGHVLQRREKGFMYFWLYVAPLSLWSAAKSVRNKNHKHMHTKSEWLANQLSYNYFNQPDDWDFNKYPIDNHQVPK